MAAPLGVVAAGAARALSMLGKDTLRKAGSSFARGASFNLGMSLANKVTQPSGRSGGVDDYEAKESLL